jgi:hypothetical protein
MTYWEIVIAPLVVISLLVLYRFVGCQLVFGLDEYQPGPPPAVPPPGLAASWRLSEPTTTTSGDVAHEEWDRHSGTYQALSQSPEVAPDSAPLPTTSLGSGAFVAPAGGFTAGVPGIIRTGEETCVRFNGGFVRILDADPNAQDQLSPPASFSLVAWVWPEAPPPPGDKTYRAVITCRSDDGVSKRGYVIYAGPDDPTAANPVFSWQAWVGVGNAWRSVIGAVVRFDRPTGLVVTYNQALARLRLYDIVLDDTADIPDTLVPHEQSLAPDSYLPADSTRPLYIGAGRTDANEPGSAPNYWFLGLVQEVRVYNVELTDEEIANIIASGAMST